MHGSSLKRMQWFVDTFLSSGTEPMRVLDVGSCDVAGGTYRQFFDPKRFEYSGLDLGAGPNVDIVPAKPYAWSEISDNCFDVVISGQAFEHMEFFWLAAGEIARVLKPEGLMCIVAPRGFSRHRYPVDCYRFDADGMIAIARWCNLIPLHASTDMAPPNAGPEWHIEDCEDSLLVAKKPQNWHGTVCQRQYEYVAADTEALSWEFTACAKEQPEGKLAVEEPVMNMNHEKEEYEKVLKSMENELIDLRQRVRAYENSNSWRLTAPLRALRKAIRKLAKPE